MCECCEFSALVVGVFMFLLVVVWGLGGCCRFVMSGWVCSLFVLVEVGGGRGWKGVVLVHSLSDLCACCWSAAFSFVSVLIMGRVCELVMLCARCFRKDEFAMYVVN